MLKLYYVLPIRFRLCGELQIYRNFAIHISSLNACCILNDRPRLLLVTEFIGMYTSHFGTVPIWEIEILQYTYRP